MCTLISLSRQKSSTISLKRREYKVDDRAKKVAVFFRACEANPDTRLSIHAAMRAKGYSDVEAADQILVQQVRRESQKKTPKDTPCVPLWSTNQTWDGKAALFVAMKNRGKINTLGVGKAWPIGERATHFNGSARLYTSNTPQSTLAWLGGGGIGQGMEKRLRFVVCIFLEFCPAVFFMASLNCDRAGKFDRSTRSPPMDGCQRDEARGAEERTHQDGQHLVWAVPGNAEEGRREGVPT